MIGLQIKARQLRTIRPMGALVVVCGAWLVASATVVGVAQEAAPPPDEPATAERLSGEQEALARKYRRFEELLLRLAESSADSDPGRSDLLRKAIVQSKERQINARLSTLIELLSQQRLSTAVKNQTELTAQLEQLLQLLMSENRREELARRQEQIREYLEKINQLIAEQQSLESQNQRGAAARRLAENQGQLAEDTGKLVERMQADAGKQASDGKPSESSDGESAEPSDSEQGEPGGESQTDGEPSESDANSSPSEGQNSSGESQQSPGSNSSDANQQGGEQDAQQRLESAQQRMREAQQKLEQAQREDAAEQQQQALRELEQAKAELERVLRQMREEERRQMLAWLEERFRKMLALQQAIYDGTVRLGSVPVDDRNNRDEIAAGRLARDEDEIVALADKALELLREEGSAVAMPEAVLEVREDMRQVAERLREAKVEELTQSIEMDVMLALEEMIAALVQEQQQNDQQQSDAGEQGDSSEDPSLIDRLAELKMLRSLQMRVNRRTERYAQQIDGNQAESAELLEALSELAQREERIFQATRNLALGVNE